MSIYGFIIGICFVIGIQYFSSKNHIIPKKLENTFIILLLVISLIGARLYAVISEWDYYSQNLVQILNTRGGGMGIIGGILFGAIFIFVYSKLYKLPFLKILDTITPIIPLGQSIGRWGNYFNQEIYSINGQPIWLYESFLNLLLFFILIKSKNNQTAKYLIGYGLIRFFTEFLRWDTFIVNNIKIGQIISLFFIFVGTSILFLKKSESKSNIV